MGVVAQQRLRFAQGIEHHAIEAGQRDIGAGFHGPDACPVDPGREVPGNAGAETPAAGNGIAHMLQHAGVAGAGAEGDFGVHHRGGNADVGRRRGQHALGSANVRTALEQSAAIAHWQRLSQLRRVVAGRHRRRQIAGRTGEQRGDLVERSGLLRFEGREFGAQRLDLRTGPCNVHFIAATAGQQPLRHVQLLLLDPQRMLGDLQFLAGMAGCEVVADHLGHHGDARCIQCGCTGIGTGTGRLRRTLEFAEQVELITHRKAGIREVHDWYLFSQGQRLAGKLAASERAGCAELDFLGVVGHLEAFIGAAQVVVGQPHIGVVGQRFVDQPVEEGVVIELPPVGGQRRLIHLRVVQQVERGARVGPLDHRVARHLIVGADHGAGA